MGKAKGTSEVETRDANKHLSAQKSPSPGKKKKKIQAQNINNAKQNSSKGQGFWNQNI